MTKKQMYCIPKKLTFYKLKNFTIHSCRFTPFGMPKGSGTSCKIHLGYGDETLVNCGSLC